MSAPATPEAAGRIFGMRLTTAVHYAHLLATTGVEWGLLGPREVDRLWPRHILNSAALAELPESVLPKGAHVLDVGSGAGLPGIPLVLARPDLTVTLVEPLARRAAFLQDAVAALELDSVTVLRGRAEDAFVVREVGGAQVVTARAVAPLDRLVGWCLPLVRRGGVLLAMKGASAEEELDRHAAAIRRAGGGQIEILRCGADIVDPPATVVVVRRNGGKA